MYCPSPPPVFTVMDMVILHPALSHSITQHQTFSRRRFSINLQGARSVGVHYDLLIDLEPQISPPAKNLRLIK